MNILKRIKKQIILITVNTVFRGTHAFEIKRFLLNMCDGIIVGSGSKIVTPVHIPQMSILEIGNNCWIGRDFTFEGNGIVRIGNNCDLGPNVICVTGSHKIGSTLRRAGEGYNSMITVGNGTWICANSMLLPDASVGNGCIIGAGGIVTKKLPDNGMFVGQPVKLLRKLTDYEE